MYQEEPGKTGSPLYLSYLIRLWRSTGSQDWLASLEAPGTHELHSFASLASFFAFLQEQTGNGHALEEIEEQGQRAAGTDRHPEPP